MSVAWLMCNKNKYIKKGSWVILVKNDGIIKKMGWNEKLKIFFK